MEDSGTMGSAGMTPSFRVVSESGSLKKLKQPVNTRGPLLQPAPFLSLQIRQSVLNEKPNTKPIHQFLNRNRSFRYHRFSRILPLLGAVGLCLSAAPGKAEEGPVADQEAPADPVLQPGIVEEITERPLTLFDGRSPIRAGFEIEGYHDDNVFVSPAGTEARDYVLEFIPEVIFESSDPDDGKRYYFTFGYDPRVLRFMDFSRIDSVNHRGFAGWRFRGNRVKARLDHRSVQFSGAERRLVDLGFDPVDTDVGRRVDGDHHISLLNADVELGEKSQLESEIKRVEQNLESLRRLDTEWLSGEFILVHQVAPKTQAGVGSEIGQIDFEAAPQTSYQQVFGVIRHSLTERVSIDLSGGADFRQFAGPGSNPDRNSGIVAGRLAWKPRESTFVSLDLFRDVGYSVIGDAMVKKGGRGVIRQRLSKKLHYQLLAGYEQRDYLPTVRGAAGGREDDYTFIFHRLDYELAGGQHTVGVFHEYRRNTSSRVLGFKQNLLGVRVSVGF